MLTKGNILLVLPSEDTYEARERGEYLPFWVCKVVEDEGADLGTLSCALHVRSLHTHARVTLMS